MENIINKIDGIAEKIKRIEEKRKKLADFLIDIKDQINFERDKEVMEKFMMKKIKPEKLSHLIVGVDGGLIKQPYHSLDLILTRAVAASFRYKDGKLKSVSYFPSPSPSPKPSIITGMNSTNEFNKIADLERTLQEAKIVNKVEGDIVLLDGSIVPHSSGPEGKYKELVKIYNEIFESGKLVAGIVEDSRSNRFSNIISKKVLERVKDSRKKELQNILENILDTNLLFHVLKPGERTFVFKYSKNNNHVGFIKDIGEKGGNIYSFYLKTTEYDRPVRVDFHATTDPGSVADKISSLVLPASSHHQAYGIPVPIIEADSCAKLRENEMDMIYNFLRNRLGPGSFMRLRRDSRPF